MSQAIASPTRRTVGVRDIPWVLFAPRRLFARVEDVPAYAWPLVVLLTLVTLVGYATVQTGLIDRQVDEQVAAAKARIDEQQRNIVERSELRELYANQEKQGEFTKMLTRMRVIILEPAKMLATVLLTGAVLYGMVALTGRKPEWHTLLTLCVFAAFIELLRLIFRLVLMLRHASLDVATSPAPAVRLLMGEDAPAQQVIPLEQLATALDPFRVWFWIVVLIGLSVTSQLKGWRAWLICVLMWLGAAGMRSGMAAAALQGGTMGS
jgi:hypothetical protein